MTEESPDRKLRALPVPATPDRDDRALLAAIARGEGTALAALFDRLGGMALGVCLRILGDRAEAEEALSDVFLELWRRPERYDPGRGHPAAYLATIARSRALDRLRSRSRRERHEIGIGRREPAAEGVMMKSPGADPYQAAVLAEERDRIRQALATLAAAERRALELAYFEGLTQREIAARLAAPLGTVKTHIRRGLERLREALRRAPGQEGGNG